ncbi:hypothetical protein [Planctomicrobium piriforme]|uniref:hypothetical protein n=1 Tax=Planctomicrobium piriforme TaxID=1576369 RepID=UPI001587A76E|nr:hypothetical protein [Planctomicrobium piriforme]
MSYEFLIASPAPCAEDPGGRAGRNVAGGMFGRMSPQTPGINRYNPTCEGSNGPAAAFGGLERAPRGDLVHW